MEFIAFFLFGFLACFIISSIFNFVFNMRSRRDWIITLVLSIVLGLIFLPFMVG